MKSNSYNNVASVLIVQSHYISSLISHFSRNIKPGFPVVEIALASSKISCVIFACWNFHQFCCQTNCIDRQMNIVTNYGTNQVKEVNSIVLSWPGRPFNILSQLPLCVFFFFFCKTGTGPGHLNKRTNKIKIKII